MNQRNQADSSKVGHIGWSPDYKPSIDYKPILCQLLCELDGKTEMLDKVMDEIRHYRSIRFLVFENMHHEAGSGLQDLIGAFYSKEEALALVGQRKEANGGANACHFTRDFYIVDLMRLQSGIGNLSYTQKYIGEEV